MKWLMILIMLFCFSKQENPENVVIYDNGSIVWVGVVDLDYLDEMGIDRHELTADYNDIELAPSAPISVVGFFEACQKFPQGVIAWLES